MGNMQCAFNKVRAELWELGLLADGRYRDRVDFVISPLPIFLPSEAGYVVFEQGIPLLSRLVGFGEGTNNIPRSMRKHPHGLCGGSATSSPTVGRGWIGDPSGELAFASSSGHPCYLWPKWKFSNQALRSSHWNCFPLDFTNNTPSSCSSFFSLYAL